MSGAPPRLRERARRILSSSGGPAWVEFHPYEEPPARVCLAGRTWELDEVELSDLLSIVDEAEELSRTMRNLGNC